MSGDAVVSALPELNQLVEARGRHWVVTEVLASALDPDPLKGVNQVQHLVSLVSVDDGGHGDTAELVWEVEPGTRVLTKETLPTPRPGEFDDPDRLDAFLDAVRWSAITSADSKALQSPFRSGISIDDYQLDPVVRALRMPRVNLLVADDVGLGKTIEAGLVIQEMLLRHRARTVVVVCPASLCIKWQNEMQEKFGLEFRIVDSELIRDLRRDRGLGSNPWRHFPRLIVSIDWLKMPRAMSLFRDVLPTSAQTYPRAFDLLVIDEVHTVAPSGRGKYAKDSLRTKAIRELAPHFEHRLYLSATPHNGFQESWTALLELLDPQRFARGVLPSPAAVKEIMVRRLKSELRDDPALRKPDGSPPFAERVIETIEVDYPQSEREIHALLAQYTSSRRTSAGRGTSARTAADFVNLLLKKRLFSSPRAFAQTLAVHRATLRENARQASERSLRDAFDRLEDDGASEAEQQEATEDALARAGAVLGVASKDQEALLDRMEAWAQRERERPDAKATALLQYLDATCRPGGVWNNERVIVFTEYRDTQLYLYDLLSSRLPEGDLNDRVELLFGGMDAVRRERVKDEFQEPPSETTVRILLATDAASEGIDLQRHCYRLVHVETPFNPARMEQRNGRVDRHGQAAPQVLLHHFVSRGWEDEVPADVHADTADLADELGFLVRLARKVEQQRADLGSVGPLLAEQVERRMTGDRTATLDVRPGERRRAASEALKVERRLREDVARLADAVRESRAELGINPAAVERVVRTGLAVARNQPPLIPTTLIRDGVKLPVFEVGSLTGPWARAVSDLPHPVKDTVRPITFDHQVAQGKTDVVLAHLHHPLVASCTRLLRAAMWATGDRSRGIHRVAAKVIADRDLDELAAIVHARLVVLGSGGHVLHEEIITAGGRIAGGRFSRTGWGPERIATVLSAATTERPPRHVEDALAAVWAPTIEGPLREALGARSNERADSLERHIVDECARQIQASSAVLSQLQTQIQSYLTSLDQPQQLTLGFDDDEKRQFERDLDALRSRVLEIPEEIEREAVEIRRRFESRSLRMFPVAITFLVPKRLCTSGLAEALGTVGAVR
jgi:superfamily II DNA or RNA helicase